MAENNNQERSTEGETSDGETSCGPSEKPQETDRETGPANDRQQNQARQRNNHARESERRAGQRTTQPTAEARAQLTNKNEKPIALWSINGMEVR